MPESRSGLALVRSRARLSVRVHCALRVGSRRAGHSAVSRLRAATGNHTLRDASELRASCGLMACYETRPVVTSLRPEY